MLALSAIYLIDLIIVGKFPVSVGIRTHTVSRADASPTTEHARGGSCTHNNPWAANSALRSSQACSNFTIDNMRPLRVTGATVVWLGLASAGAYVWPSPYDEIEDILSLQSGYLGRNFVAGEPRLSTPEPRLDSLLTDASRCHPLSAGRQCQGSPECGRMDPHRVPRHDHIRCRDRDGRPRRIGLVRAGSC